MYDASNRMPRRTFLGRIGAGVSGILLLSAWSDLPAKVSQRRLAFRHTHTDERLSIVYYEGGRYLPDALAKINHLLRDHRTGEVCAIDPALLDFLYDATALTHSRRAIEVISGYRSPATNRMLQAKSKGVAKKSLHMQGKAIDIRLPDVDSAKLRKVAVAMKRGGVGYYPRPDFVHLDVGRVRTW